MIGAAVTRQEATILMADDNPAERRLAERTFGRGVINCDLRMVSDGEEALDYLYRRGAYEDPSSAPRPDLVLLDLNMPKIDGRQVLETMKGDSALRRIPVVVLTTSRAETDIAQSYELGCNSFLAKPVSLGEFVDTLRTLGDYWFKLVVFPPKER